MEKHDVLVRRRRRELATRSLRSAAGQPRSIAVLSGFLTASLMLLALGGLGPAAVTLVAGTLGYAAFVTFDLCDAARPTRAAPDGSSATLPAVDVAPEEIEGLELRADYQQILVRHAELATLAGSGGPLGPAMSDAFRRCGDLVREAGRAAVRSNILGRYLRDESADAIRKRAADLEDRALLTRDLPACQLYVQAAEASTEHACTHDDIQGAYDRIHAQLQATEAALAGMRARMVYLHASDGGEGMRAATTELNELSAELGHLHDQLASSMP